MDNLSTELNAAIRSLSGEYDLDTVRPALADWVPAHIIALAPHAHPIVRAVAALSEGLFALLSDSIIFDPALHDVLVRMIGTPEGRSLLQAWVQIAPAGWGRAHATALVHAFKNDTISASVAAALIGPCDESASLLRDAYDIAMVIRRWGQSSPDNPTRWMHTLSADARDRLIDTVGSNLYSIARCLPWLPPDMADQIRLDDDNIDGAIDAFVASSPTARARHPALAQRLIARASSKHLHALTRLACAMKEEKVWLHVQALVQESPDAVADVVSAAPWKSLAKCVRNTMLAHAVQSDICAAVAAAQGRASAERITSDSAIAFFAALDPNIWKHLPSAERRRWRDALPNHAAHLAVRSLGLHPEFLACAWLNNDLVRTARRFVRDAKMLRWTLLPVALRDASPDEAHALITALPTLPPDPGAFFCIINRRDDLIVINLARTVLHTPADLALAVGLQRYAHRHDSLRKHCTALQRMLRGWTWDDLNPILPLLDNDGRATFIPNDDMIARLAHPDRQMEMRQALARLTTLLPEVAVPIVVALNQRNPEETMETAETLADALRAHGDVFMAMVDAIADRDLQIALLPLPKHDALADALRALARDDPLIAQRLAYALRDEDWFTTIHMLLTAPPRHADLVWQALNDAARSEIVASVAAMPSDIDPITARDPIAALALAAVQADDEDLRNAGIAALAARPAWVRVIWDQAPQEVQQRLCAYLEFADLKETSERPADRRIPRR